MSLALNLIIGGHDSSKLKPRASSVAIHSSGQHDFDDDCLGTLAAADSGRCLELMGGFWQMHPYLWLTFVPPVLLVYWVRVSAAETEV